MQAVLGYTYRHYRIIWCCMLQSLCCEKQFVIKTY